MENVFCPDCPVKINSRGREVRPRLECVEDNYSGTGMDIGECPNCHHVFGICYKVTVDSVERLRDWENLEDYVTPEQWDTMRGT
jgi:hypothetical protein